MDSSGHLKFNKWMVEYLPEANSANTLFWLSGAFAFLVAGMTGIFAGPKYWRELQAREWDRAHQAYEKFLDVAIEHPEFIPGYWSCPDRSAGDRNKYRWFMARFLWAAEQALLRVSWRRRKEWKQAIKVMLREHADFIASPEAREEVDCYYGPLKQLIRETIDEALVLSPPSSLSERARNASPASS